MSCRAYRVGDQMACSCGLRWDVNDPALPYCKAAAETPVFELHVDGRKPARKRFRVAAVPPADEIPKEAAHAMALEYEKALHEYRAMPLEDRRIKAMRGAFALFLKP
jgi:hypothetical protein